MKSDDQPLIAQLESIYMEDELAYAIRTRAAFCWLGNRKLPLLIVYKQFDVCGT